MPRSKSKKHVNLTLSALKHRSVQILKKVNLKMTLHIFIYKKKVQAHLDIIFLCVT